MGAVGACCGGKMTKGNVGVTNPLLACCAMMSGVLTPKGGGCRWCILGWLVASDLTCVTQACDGCSHNQGGHVRVVSSEGGSDSCLLPFDRPGV